MTNKNKFKLDVDLNVINHLGVGLYSSTPAALTELVANAWDADATEVHITIDPEAKSITIEDNGHGMTAEAVQKKFLNVGYSRRRHSQKKDRSDSGKRKVMGRKGIGKLAMFALAEHVKISSKAEGLEPVGFLINVPALRKNLENHIAMELDEFEPSTFINNSGTKIVLDSVHTGLKTTESYLKIKLARRFSVFGSAYGFRVFLNGYEITMRDRGIYDHVQFLWAFDAKSKNDVMALAPNLAKYDALGISGTSSSYCVQMVDSNVTYGDLVLPVTGYVASVFKPQNLGNREDSANILSVFANGRMFTENILDEANSAKFYQSYLVGEIHADFLDADDIDRATASREAIKRDDPKYQALLGFVRSTLEGIGDQWDDWRGEDSSDKGNIAVEEWLKTLTDKRDLSVAKKLMSSIKNATVNSNDVKNEAAKKILYRGAILGFEKLKLRNQLDQLINVHDVLSDEFAAIFNSLNQVEEAAYYEITRQRLEIIKKFKDIADDPKSLEKVAQQYLFEHLWLLDPSWDRVSGGAQMELTLTEYLKKEQPDSSGARLDISYRASSGRHIIVELKKPSKTSLDFFELLEQVSKYKDAITAYFRQKEPNKPVPPLDIYLLIARAPSNFDESKRRSLEAVDGKIITYSQLINDANTAYQSYLDAKSNAGALEAILSKL